MKHPLWNQSRRPPWSIAKARAWAAATLAPDPSKQHDEPESLTAELDGMAGLKRHPLMLAKLKLMLVRAEKLAVEKAILTGEYMKRSEVEQGRLRRAYAAKAVLERIPREMAYELVGLTESQIHDRLYERIREALFELINARMPEGLPDDGSD